MLAGLRSHAHPHMVSCTVGGGREVHGTKQSFDDHRLRRQRLVLDKIADQRPEVAAILKRILANDLEDLNIQFKNDSNHEGIGNFDSIHAKIFCNFIYLLLYEFILILR